MSKPDWAERLQRTFKRKYDEGYSDGLAAPIDMQNICVWCREDTSFGSGKFVNRIPVSTTVEALPYDIFWEEPDVVVEGYGCEACYEGENVDECNS